MISLELAPHPISPTGICAGLAWAVLAPIAISSSLGRHLIPRQGLWFEIHRALNTAVVVCTVVASALAFKAISDAGIDHFQSLPGAINKHKTVGLVVFLIVPLQALAGFLRPHAVDTDENGEPKDEKPKKRIAWEIGHRSLGFILLLLAWYQVHSGLSKYSELYFTSNLSFAFWIVALCIMLPGAGVFAYKKLMDPLNHDSDGASPDDAAEEQPSKGNKKKRAGSGASSSDSNEEKHVDAESQLSTDDAPAAGGNDDLNDDDERPSGLSFAQKMSKSIRSMRVSKRSSGNIDSGEGESKRGGMASSQQSQDDDPEQDWDDENDAAKEEGDGSLQRVAEDDDEDATEKGGNNDFNDEEPKKKESFLSKFLPWGRKKEEESDDSDDSDDEEDDSDADPDPDEPKGIDSIPFPEL